MYDKLVTTVYNVDISGFVLKTKYGTDKSDLRKENKRCRQKNPGTSGLGKKTNRKAKITDIESKIQGISGLATDSALTAVENKIPDVSSLVKNRL